MKANGWRKCEWPAVLLLVVATAGHATPLDTPFTYQGQLKQAGASVNERADFQFSLWDAPAGGAQVGATLPMNDTSVSHGLFTVYLDFETSPISRSGTSPCSCCPGCCHYFGVLTHCWRGRLPHDHSPEDHESWHSHKPTSASQTCPTASSIGCKGSCVGRRTTGPNHNASNYTHYSPSCLEGTSARRNRAALRPLLAGHPPIASGSSAVHCGETTAAATHRDVRYPPRIKSPCRSNSAVFRRATVPCEGRSYGILRSYCCTPSQHMPCDALALREPRLWSIGDAGMAIASGRLERRLDRLLNRTRTHPANERLGKHLARHRGWLFAFLRDPELDATNR